eukprot:gene6093-14450_t
MPGPPLPPDSVACIIQRRTAAYDCKKNNQGQHCNDLVVSGDDQNSTDLIVAFRVEVDGQWGPYLYCNPTDNKHPSAPWDCDTCDEHHNTTNDPNA